MTRYLLSVTFDTDNTAAVDRIQADVRSMIANADPSVSVEEATLTDDKEATDLLEPDTADPSAEVAPATSSEEAQDKQTEPIAPADPTSNPTGKEF